MIGLQYTITSAVLLLVGFSLMLMRWIVSPDDFVAWLRGQTPR